jgi:protein-L-isoaspartate O-methyltransferase
MSKDRRSHLSARHFESLYAGSKDPWDFRHSRYERARYGALFRVLGRPRYRRAFEPGCSVGVFTETLARCCDEVLATDIALRAVNIARERLAGLPNVSVRQRDLRDGPPEGRFDLIVLSEVGYYFSIEQLSVIAQALESRLTPGGELIAAHWLGHSSHHQLHGDEVHDLLRSALHLRQSRAERYEGFRVDRWIRS